MALREYISPCSNRISSLQGVSFFSWPTFGLDMRSSSPVLISMHAEDYFARAASLFYLAVLSEEEQWVTAFGCCASCACQNSFPFHTNCWVGHCMPIGHVESLDLGALLWQFVAAFLKIWCSRNLIWAWVRVLIKDDVQSMALPGCLFNPSFKQAAVPGENKGTLAPVQEEVATIIMHSSIITNARPTLS